MDERAARERRARARLRAEARRHRRLEELAVLDARYTIVAAAAALEATWRGRGRTGGRRPA